MKNSIFMFLLLGLEVALVNFLLLLND